MRAFVASEFSSLHSESPGRTSDDRPLHVPLGFSHTRS